ncbi:MAG TPA: c-type cytochrome biogenesis protein CcsB [Bacteroidales bacterium]|nr:c-type cytochrome biogenesis protein CcsB [Bacteroidales bacterium]
MKKSFRIFNFLFSPVFMGCLLVIFAVAMAVATFIENDYGSRASHNMIYGARWFEMIFLLLIINMAGQVVRFRMYRKEKLSVALLHLSFVIIILGAGITRYTGWEGTMRIREGESSDICSSSGQYLGFVVKDGQENILVEESERFDLTSFRKEDYNKRINIEDRYYELSLKSIIPNAVEDIVNHTDGTGIIAMMIVDRENKGEMLILEEGRSKEVLGLSFSFDAGIKTDVEIKTDSGKFFLFSEEYETGVMSMMSGEASSVSPGNKVTLEQMQVITIDGVRIVPQKMFVSGIIVPVPVSPREQNTGRNALVFNFVSGGKEERVILWHNSSGMNAETSYLFDSMELRISYGAGSVRLPFSLKLTDFTLDRYPGSESPSGYRSDVILYDKTAGVEMPYSIFMNNILKYKGYRFFQSSFDEDEKGTVLSVNHDPAGIGITYTGYALLFLSIVLTLLNRNSLFYKIKTNGWDSPFRKILFLTGFLIAVNISAKAAEERLVPPKKASDIFGHTLVQDQKGRTKPLYTLSNDILRKVTGKNTFEGNTSMQVYLGLYLDFERWQNVPLIKVSNKELRQELGIKNERAAFSELVNIAEGSYRIADRVNSIYSRPPGSRSKKEKEILKVDERVNILFMLQRGDFMKIIPLKDGFLGWGSPQQATDNSSNTEDSLFISGLTASLLDALETDNVSEIKILSESISRYQHNHSGYTLPDELKIKAEILYYKLAFFERLFPFYATVGTILLISLIIMVITGSRKPSLLMRGLIWLLIGGFLFHTMGLGLRWYVSGHSPMSNGYESLIFISWVTLLAGLIFSRKSLFALSATAVLAGMALMVAHLSFMDPEITNLVPVLQSYWLTLHVSIITASYGFLGLGAILGILVMVLMIFINRKNRQRISDTIDELTLINYKSLNLGLYMLTIGTFLGAIWANESWGRYWGWDPKETWSLITIVVYTLVVHSRMIPGMKDIFSFNLFALLAFSSVLMTYFGVNYYLSGLHSYAGGDSLNVPGMVYLVLVIVAGISITAYIRYRGATKQLHKYTECN